MSIDEQKTPEIEDLERELETNPFSLRALNQIAKLHADRCDYREACQCYEKIVRFDRDNSKALASLGYCYLLIGEYNKSFAAYQRAIYAMPDIKDPQLWYGIGLLYSRFESYENAEPACQAVLRLDPDFEKKYEVMYNLGYIYKKRNFVEHAITYFNNSLLCKKIPLSRKVDALSQLANCYEKLGNREKAVEICNEASELKPEDAKSLEFLGWMMACHGKEEEALKHLKRSLELVRDNTGESGDLYYLIGRVYLQQRKFLDGQRAFQNAIYKNTNVCIYWASIGVLYAEAHQPQEALECFVKANSIAGDVSEVWYDIGVLYERYNQKLEAVLAYTRAQALDPSNFLAANRKRLVSSGNSSFRPDFIHPTFEISEVPFSIKMTERPMKPMKMIPPTIYKIKSEENGGPESTERKAAAHLGVLSSPLHGVSTSNMQPPSAQPSHFPEEYHAAMGMPSFFTGMMMPGMSCQQVPSGMAATGVNPQAKPTVVQFSHSDMQSGTMPPGIQASMMQGIPGIGGTNPMQMHPGMSMHIMQMTPISDKGPIKQGVMPQYMNMPTMMQMMHMILQWNLFNSMLMQLMARTRMVQLYEPRRETAETEAAETLVSLKQERKKRPGDPLKDHKNKRRG